MIDPSQTTPMPTGTTASSFPQEHPVDRSAPGLQYQDYTLKARATGSTNGVARRSSVSASAGFSSPLPAHTALSAGQFGTGSAKTTMT